MNLWNTVDLVLFSFAGLVAVTALLKLVAARRAELLEQLDTDIEAQNRTARS